MTIYTVQPGDSVYSIAHRFDVSVQKVLSDNSLADNQPLVIGQALVINPANSRHTVAPGQSLYSIAKDYGTTVAEILNINPTILHPSVIRVGQVIAIPARTQQKTMIEVNGYAFPSIEMDTLEKTLPHLTYNSIFSYQVRPDGSLIPIEDDPLIKAARLQAVASIMVITNIKEGGSFDSNLAHVILNNEQVQNTVLDNVVATLGKRYYGLDIDFEYIYKQDRDKYNRFLKKAVDRLHPLGYIVVTSLAPKTAANQQGLLYEAHDYAVHGTLADHVVLMTYEWGYTYGPARAVAPVNLVEKVLQYAVTVIPSKKILMGMPNYGYDWTLPFVKGSAAKSLTNLEAVELAAKVGANIQFDKTAQAPFYQYYSGRWQHTVWFEDARSIEAKLKLVDQYNLGGVSYWTINKFFPQNWLVLESMYHVKKVL